MKIKSISRWEFNQFVPRNFLLESFVGTQAGWWTNETRSIIGTIARATTEPKWRCVLMVQDADGDFQVCDLQWEIKSRLAASVHLFRAMEAAQKSRTKQPALEGVGTHL
jgi:hypothetical protein